MPDFHDEVATNKKPEWLKIKLRTNEGYSEVARIVEARGLHTICSSGRCPNQAECWSRRTASFMILGEVCTRSCKFCATSTGKPLPPDPGEPPKVADAVAAIGLKHCVITSVTRDDLADSGARHWAAVVRAVREKNPTTTIELLIPDMDARAGLLDIIIDSQPDIIGHNVETVERLTPAVRSRARFGVSMAALHYIAQSGIPAKSGLMVGLGETDAEVVETMELLLDNGCRIATIGQYLQPTAAHLPVAEYVTPEKFAWYKRRALDMGFSHVESGPLVRSSYMAERALGNIEKLRSRTA